MVQVSFTPAADGRSVQIMSRVNLRKPSYNPEEYAGLREIYTQLVAKHAEPVVLKRKS